MLYALLKLIFITQAFAGISIKLNDPIIYELLPPNGKLDCRLEKQKSFGYILERNSDKTLKVSVINNNVNEGEKTAFNAKIERDSLQLIYIKHHQRDEKYGRYIEFMIQRQRNAAKNDGFPGTVAFTDSLYSKDESGKESEELFPIARSPIRCNPI